MIKIRKPSTSPIVPNNRGICKLATETTNNNAAYNVNSADYDAGILKFEFDTTLYGHTNIKSVLRDGQNGKCAFCEQSVSSVSHGDIEHFRPKKGYSQNLNDTLSYPGYYWLAYEWDNLLFCCQICNQRYKKNLFHLRNPELRAKNHNSNVKYEKPFYINPARENPKFLIGFNEEVAYGKDKAHRGKKTIEGIGLNRKGASVSDLLELRLDHYDLVFEIFNLSMKQPSASIAQAEIDRAKKLMKRFRDRRKPFAAMVRENFPE
jgi:uncharacterized protein (TIGR02646 family)